MQKQTFTYQIIRDGKTIETFANQESDSCVFKYFHSHHSFSVSWLLKHEGYQVKIINDIDGSVEFMEG